MAGLLMLFASRSRRIGKLTVRGAGLFTLLLAICIPATGCSGGLHRNLTQPGHSRRNLQLHRHRNQWRHRHAETVTLTVN